MIICLETSTSVCSVALFDSNGIVALKESSEDKSHASRLTLFVRELLDEAGISANELEAVVVSKGPGSYTGLRIGVSAAKGIAYGADVPLIGIDTTLSMFSGINDEIRKKYRLDKTSLYVPMLDARRMEIYYAVYNDDGTRITDITAEVINENSFSNIPGNIKLLFFGNGAEKCNNVIKRQNIEFADEFRMSAAFMYKPAYKAFKEYRFEDIAYFEPFYLKDFIASQPKKNILGK